MNKSSLRFVHALRGAAAVLAALTASAAMAQEAGPGADCAPRLTHMQQRLYDKASRGPGVLRDFMFARRNILQLDIYETGLWASSVDTARASCVKELARSSGALQAASPLTEPAPR